MIRVVLDANVLISGLISSTGPPGEILDAWLDGKFQIILSPQIFEELSRVLYYPRIQKRLSPEQAGMLLEKLAVAAEWVEGVLGLDILKRDAADNAYLACAVEARVEFLVTGNLKHFEEVGNKYSGVEILNPQAFLEALESE